MSDKHDHTDPPAGPAPEGRQAELEALFQRWDERRAAETTGGDDPDLDEDVQAPRAGFLGGGARVVLTGLIVALAAFAMWNTRHEFAFWLQRGQAPVELGDLGARYRAGERELGVASNQLVHASGLYATYALSTGPDADEQLAYFLCPLFDISVRTAQPVNFDTDMRHYAHVEVPAEFAELLEQRRALPSDFLQSYEVTGRLIRAHEAPGAHRRWVRQLAAQARLQPSEMWVLLDGDRPEDYQRYAIIWFISPVLALASIALLVGGMFRRRRAT